MALDDVLGIVKPCAATIGTTIVDVRLPGTPPMQCLSTTSMTRYGWLQIWLLG